MTHLTPCLPNSFRDPSHLVRLAIGYFYIPGAFALIDRLASVAQTRLLVDNLSHPQTAEQLVRDAHHIGSATEVAAGWEHQSRPQARRVVEATVAGFARGLELTEQTEENRLAGLRFLELLDVGKLQLRIHARGPLNARFCLAGPADGSVSVAWAGSANPLLPLELDPTAVAVAVTDATARSELAGHFERLWNDAPDATALLADVIRRSWVAFLASPYDVYMKTLYTLVRDRLEFDPVELPGDEDVTDRLADFQRAAFRQAVRVIQEYGGAFVADVVGLGKSFIGAAVVRYFERMEHARPLIVCPAPLVEMWQAYNETHRLNAHVVSTGALRSTTGGNPLLDDVRYRDRDFVLIDESHAFRNSSTQRYRVLSEFMARGRRRACLLTATPRNRSGWDVYHQIKLFHPDDRTTLPVDPPNLRDYFRQAEDGRRELPPLLGHLLVRRTRNHILRFYGRDAETGRPVDPNNFRPYRDGARRAYIEVAGRRQFFPRRMLSTAEYSIEMTYRGLYDRLRTYLTPPPLDEPEPRAERLRFARYRVGDYLTDKAATRPEYSALRTTSGLHGMIRVMLFKRFESSVEAFRLTIRRMIHAHREMLRALSSGTIPLGDVRAAAESDGDDADADGRYPVVDFDTDRLAGDLDFDIGLLNRMLGLIELITPAQDEKLQTLIRRLATAPLLGAKRLIFTQFADTARYLGANLSHLDSAGARVEVLTSETKEKTSVVARFAPRANPDAPSFKPDAAIGTLISTDVLSEGLNLQDAAAVVNYDLHWNPVRLIQRFGRVDRIGSEHDQVIALNFLPETELERTLGLREVLRRRIRDIHETIGEDSSILEAGEELNENAMYAIYESGAAVDALEEPEEGGLHLAEAEELLRHLRETDPTEFARIAALPDGLRSTRRAKRAGVFAFLQAGAYRELMLLDERGHIVSNDIPRVLALLQCTPDTRPVGEYPSELASVLVTAGRMFNARAAERQTELRHTGALTTGQRYALRELRAVVDEATGTEDRERLERLAALFRHPLAPAANRELNRARRDGLNGQPLVRLLAAIAHAHGMTDREPDHGVSRYEPTVVVCSVGFLASSR